MVKCYYLNGKYPQKEFKHDNSIEICLNGVGGNGLLIKDRHNQIDIHDIKAFNLFDDTAESFIQLNNCKVLITEQIDNITINNDNVISCIMNTI